MTGEECPDPGSGTFQLISFSVQLVGIVFAVLMPDPFGPRNRVHSCAGHSLQKIQTAIVATVADAHRKYPVFNRCDVTFTVRLDGRGVPGSGRASPCSLACARPRTHRPLCRPPAPPNCQTASRTMLRFRWRTRRLNPARVSKTREKSGFSIAFFWHPTRGPSRLISGPPALPANQRGCFDLSPTHTRLSSRLSHLLRILMPAPSCKSYPFSTSGAPFDDQPN
jgi:hypothetical protein